VGMPVLLSLVVFVVSLLELPRTPDLPLFPSTPLFRSRVVRHLVPARVVGPLRAVHALDVPCLVPGENARYVKSVYGTERTDHPRLEEHTPDLQSRRHLVLRLLPQKKKPQGV